MRAGGGPVHVPVGGAEVPVLEVGDPAGRTVVLLPGLTDGLGPVTEPATRRALVHRTVPLPRHRGLVLSHRVDATDARRGEAPSGPSRRAPSGPSRQAPSGPLTTERLAADAAAALEQVLDGPAVLVGHSMGGMVAQHLAAGWPHLVAGLVLSAAPTHADEGVRGVLERWAALLDAGDHLGFAHDAASTSMTGRHREEQLAELVTEPPSPPRRALVDRHLALSAAACRHDARERLPDVRVPTLVLAGEHDRVVPATHAVALAAAVPGARLTVLPGVGHAFHEEARAAVRAEVVPFIERFAPSGRGRGGQELG